MAEPRDLVFHLTAQSTAELPMVMREDTIGSYSM
jgi:hypothetical protein